MNTRVALLMSVALMSVSLAISAQAQQPPAPAAPPPAPQSPGMTFFIAGNNPGGKGGDLGGLEGADRHCQQLAQNAGAGGKTWRAYLSSQGANAVNAKDSIGKGPWTNAKGVVVAKVVAVLHGASLQLSKPTSLS